MDHGTHPGTDAPVEAPPLVERRDAPGNWPSAVPLGLLALIALMALQTCMAR